MWKVGHPVRSRSLGILFIAAVILPSILLAVLSIRSAGREEAWMEKQMATTLDAEVTHTAALAAAETGRLVDDLKAGLDVPAGSDYGRILSRWKSATPVVAVPFLLSPRYGILWPPADGRADNEQKRFLRDNGDFLSDKTATTVLQNIAVRYQAEILTAAPAARAAPARAAPAPAAPAAPAPPASVEQARSSAPAARQMAIDTFAQSPEVQSKVYEEARRKGDQLNARVVEPMAGAPAADTAPVQAAADAEQDGAGAVQGLASAEEKAPLKKAEVAAQAPPPKDAAKEQPSQFVLTSQLLSQIASQGEAGLIPRFIGERLVFLFWERQKDKRIAGCEVEGTALRARIAGVLTSTWSPVRILTLLDENGAPLAVPPDAAGRDWRRPFVAREVGEALPRWEAAAYLTRPDAITAQARSSSLVIWIMVMILFVSVAGGGTMVLSSVYGEMRLAQQKATFVTNVSHELKTPLTSISLFVDLLRRKGPLPAAKKEQYLSLMASETERLTRLINNVLDFSREKGAKRYAMRAVDVSEVAEQIVESQRVRLESKGFAITLERASQPAVVRADPEALKQVLLNLLSNAEKYSAGTKEIAVVVKHAMAQEDVAVTVRDRGIGIPEKDREKVFREFYRVDESLASGVQGTGLGLTIARRIARDHGGDITCLARDGGGTDFVVKLPASRASAPSHEEDHE